MVIRYSELDELPTHPWIRGCSDWMWQHGIEGWRPYYINIMFQPLPGDGRALVEQMKRAICKGFYARFCTEFSHHPSKASQLGKLPMLWLFPDRPVWKHKKISILDVKFNDNGLHFNGPMMIPAVSRFKECPIKHIRENQRKYAVQGIDRIHIEEAKWDLDRLADYAGKTIKWGRANPDDILILPEMMKKPTGETLSSEDRAIRDIQSRHNVSEEIAHKMLELINKNTRH